jgi:hypothetical protein
MRTFRRLILAGLLAILVAGAVAPFLSAERMKPRIQAALESALHRRVRIGEAHWNLFTGPGFTLQRVQIDDDPAAGLEPFANVDSLRARVRLSSLLQGKLAFSNVYLDSPSVNLVKMSNGAWNIEPWLAHRPQTGSASIQVPDIEINGGRLNFKFVDTKSIFYISGADVDVYPNDRGQIDIRFSGVPARSDKPSGAFGQLTARGLLGVGPDGHDRLQMGLRLERTAISELAQLMNGRDLGLHGFAIADASVSGPLENLAVNGSVNINDVHRWDLMPPGGDGWTLRYRGNLNLVDHQFNLDTSSTDGRTDPVAVNFHLADYQSVPKWVATILVRDLPAASLVEVARHMGAPLPAGVQVDGKVTGSVAYSSLQGLAGGLALAGASLRVPGGGSAESEDARITLSDGKISLSPVDVRLDNGQEAQIQGSYALDNSHAAIRIATHQLTGAWLQSTAAQMLGAVAVPVVDGLKQGQWKGWIAFDRREDRPGVWSGDYELQNATIDIPGLASPVRLMSAGVKMSEDSVQITHMKGRAGKIPWDGDYRYDLGASQPQKLRLNIAQANLSDLEQLMLPTLRRDEGFFARAFRRPASPLPQWLEERKLDASIQISSLVFGDSPLGRWQGRLMWDGPSLVFNNLDCRLDRMHTTGTLAINVAGSSPSYHVEASVENLDYRNGQIDFDAALDTSGVGADLLLNVHSEGTFSGRAIALNADTLINEISGSYKIEPSAGIPRLTLSNIEATEGPELLTGQGLSQPDGRLILDLASARRAVKLTGSLLPMHLEPQPSR